MLDDELRQQYLETLINECLAGFSWRDTGNHDPKPIVANAPEFS